MPLRSKGAVRIPMASLGPTHSRRSRNIIEECGATPHCGARLPRRAAPHTRDCMLITRTDQEAALGTGAFLSSDTLRNSLDPPSESLIATPGSLDAQGSHPRNP